MTRNDLAKLCATIAHFSDKNGFRYKALPVICWEFADPGEFLHTRDELMRVCVDGYHLTPDRILRHSDSMTSEIDFYGVTFRLTCNMVWDTPSGLAGVNSPNVKIVRSGPKPDPLWPWGRQ